MLKPGWTPYQWRLIHETTDVTDLLVPGTNALGIRFAGGWATERYGFRGQAAPFYTDQPAVAGQLVITYADGRRQVVATDETWRVSTGPITASGIYHGEDHDARLAQPGWDRPGFDDAGWSAAAAADPIVTPSARTSPVVRRIEELAVREVITTPSGRTVLDFGQNLVGRLRLTVDGPAGTVITLRHAEVLEHDELGTRPLRLAKATDTLTLAGDGPITWEPELTFHGFRYAEIDGWPGAFDPGAVTAQVIHSDMERTGWFASSHALVDRLHENVVWGLRGNFLYVPTDCPQRDERLGLDRRHPGVHPDRLVPVRRARFPHLLADRPRAGAGARRRHRAVRRAERAAGSAPAGRGLGRRGHRRADGAARALRRRARADRPAGQHAGLDRRDRRAVRRPAPVGGPVPVRRLAGSRPPRRSDRPRPRPIPTSSRPRTCSAPPT